MQAKVTAPREAEVEVKHLTGDPNHDQSDHGLRPSQFEGALTTQMVSAAFTAGVRAHRNGKPITACPFVQDTAKDRALTAAWTRGWSRAGGKL